MATYIKFADGNERMYDDETLVLGCTWSGDLDYRHARRYALGSVIAPDVTRKFGGGIARLPDQVVLLKVRSVEEVPIAVSDLARVVSD